MNVALMSYCGTVGKTTIAANMLYPRLNNPEPTIFAVETVNETAAKLGLPVTIIKGANFKELYKRLPTLQNGIIDVGATNVEAFIAGPVDYGDAELDIDYFVIPTKPGSREQIEAIKTLEMLKKLGIDKNKVRVVFNEVKEDVQSECDAVLGYVAKAKYGVANTECVIYETQVYNMLASKKMTIQAALDDQTDYRALLRTDEVQNDKKNFEHYSDMRAIKALSQKAAANLDVVFENLFKG